MKGAIGNAFILNMVITFILIFYILLIGSMAFSKAYKVKNFILNRTTQFDEIARSSILDFYKVKPLTSKDDKADKFISKLHHAWLYSYTDDIDAMTKFGYQLSGYDCYISDSSLPVYSAENYDYCIELIREDSAANDLILLRYRYRVRVFMKFDFPIIGQFIKIPIRGETRTFTVFKGDI